MIFALRLQQYRSYTDESFEFDAGVNIVVGPNASGKTNLLEAILVLMVGSSYRAKDGELVQHTAPWARLDADTNEGARVCKLIQAAPEQVTKEFVIAGNSYKRLSLQKSYPVVLFEPNHLLLLTGSPERRRDYLDNLISQIKPGYSTTLRHYKRVLAQRNALLKQGRQTEQLFAWNIRLSQLAGQIVAERLSLVDYISLHLQNLYQELSGSNVSLELSYVTAVDVSQYSSDLLYKLEQNITKDLERGFTSYGPHRDDFELRLRGFAANTVASRGETRSVILVLKIIELQLIAEARGKKPLLLLDDVFSELDGARRRALTEALKTHQTFITTTDADVVLKHFTDSTRLIAL